MTNDDDYDDGEFEGFCTHCGGEGVQECDDPIQCCDPDCDGELGPCGSCYGTGSAKDQWVW